jgi:glycosyltransferase involved in cell wall biosynthesis
MNKISVCLATYNGEKYIKEQLDSILMQLNASDEVVISDDHSTDSTVAVIQSINDSRIQLHFNDKNNKGYTKNFENALKNANGDVIFLSDQDDVWMPNKVSSILVALEKNDFVVSDALIVNEELICTSGSHFKLSNSKKGFFRNWIRPRYIGACMAFQSKILEKALPFPENQKLCAHDYWIANVAEFFYKRALINEPLIKYRRHDNNASPAGKKSPNSLFKKVSIRFYTLYHLTKRIFI